MMSDIIVARNVLVTRPRGFSVEMCAFVVWGCDVWMCDMRCRCVPVVGKVTYSTVGQKCVPSGRITWVSYVLPRANRRSKVF